MDITELLKGRKVKVDTEVGVTVELEIKRVEKNHGSRDLEPATAANDWWPASIEWTNYTVHFTNGRSKQYDSLESITLA